MKVVADYKVVPNGDLYQIVTCVGNVRVVLYSDLTQYEAYKIYEKLKMLDQSLTEEAGVENYNIGYIAVDLDGTLAEYNGWLGENHIGAPIPKMVERVKNWLEQGTRVKIFTARAYGDRPEAIKYVKEWCKKYIGQELEVTNIKDYGMRVLYDDRAIQVKLNTGELLIQKKKMI
jgi:hypothetical protein